MGALSRRCGEGRAADAHVFGPPEDSGIQASRGMAGSIPEIVMIMLDRWKGWLPTVDGQITVEAASQWHRGCAGISSIAWD